jgi:hypothetical protein
LILEFTNTKTGINNWKFDAPESLQEQWITTQIKDLSFQVNVMLVNMRWKITEVKNKVTLS